MEFVIPALRKLIFQKSLSALRKPDKMFIENYESIVPDITELANYNIGMQEALRTGVSCCEGYPSFLRFKRQIQNKPTISGVPLKKTQEQEERTVRDVQVLGLYVPFLLGGWGRTAWVLSVDRFFAEGHLTSKFRLWLGSLLETGEEAVEEWVSLNS